MSDPSEGLPNERSTGRDRKPISTRLVISTSKMTDVMRI